VDYSLAKFAAFRVGIRHQASRHLNSTTSRPNGLTHPFTAGYNLSVVHSVVENKARQRRDIPQ
jgi:hypothetical protein